jgi:hypothetical protein
MAQAVHVDLEEALIAHATVHHLNGDVVGIVLRGG